MATHRLGQDRALPPGHPFPEGSGIQIPQAEAEVRSTATPGPMVEDSDTFFR